VPGKYDEADMDDFLSRNAYVLNTADRARFLPMFVEARREVNIDLRRAARLKDYSESEAFARNAPSPSKQMSESRTYGRLIVLIKSFFAMTENSHDRWCISLAAM
jgi:hypothetical protein